MESTMAERMQSTPEYALGYSESEHRRLVAQARFFEEATRGLFRRAGLEPGMRVLDVGCGPGDVSFLAAEFVGPMGRVLGVDRSASSIALARERAQAAHLENVTFHEGELTALDGKPQFDALVGRLILMYLPDPEAALAQFFEFIRPGGLVIFQELEMSMSRAVPRSPIHQACGDWIRETIRRAGFEIDMGSRLFPTFRRAGLNGVELVLDARVVGGEGSPGYDLLAQTVRSLLPMMERLGVVTAAEVQVDTLATRLEDEIRAGDGVMIYPPLIGAWARKPA
jgi:SAM-dependent methyltransferase